jgi:hypothetical protein
MRLATIGQPTTVPIEMIEPKVPWAITLFYEILGNLISILSILSVTAKTPTTTLYVTIAADRSIDITVTVGCEYGCRFNY